MCLYKGLCPKLSTNVYPWNPWENKSQANPTYLIDQDFLCVKIRKETWWCELKNVFLRLISFQTFKRRRL